jgi:hypothetical protein
MRLYTTYYLCKNNIDLFENVTGEQIAPNRDEYRVGKWPSIKQGIDNLYSISCLKEHLDEVYEIVPTVYKYRDYIEFNGANLNKFKDKLNKLITYMQAIIDLYESLGYKENENSLEVKIPDGIELNKLVKLFDDLDFVLNQCPVIEKDGKTSTVLKTDVGSMWLVLAGTYVFLKSVGYVVNVAIKAKADLAAIKQLETFSREMVQKAEISQGLNLIMKEKTKIIMQKYVDELKESFGKELDPEEEAKVEKCLSKLDGILESGVQIYAAIDTPREVQVLFPEQPDLKGLTENMLKFIEMKSQSL